LLVDAAAEREREDQGPRSDTEDCGAGGVRLSQPLEFAAQRIGGAEIGRRL